MLSALRDNASARMVSKPLVLNAWIWMSALLIPVDLRRSAQTLEEVIIASASLDLLALHPIYCVKVILIEQFQ